jgi:hypothetical protein
VEVELARAVRVFADRDLRQRLGSEQPEGEDGKRSVTIPAATMRAVETLVGREGAAEFIAIAAEREVQARALNELAANHANQGAFREVP